MDGIRRHGWLLPGAAIWVALAAGCGENRAPTRTLAQVCLADPGGNGFLVEVEDDETLRSYLSRDERVVLGTGLDERCEGGLRLRVDPGLARSRPFVGALADGAPRPVGAIGGPTGRPDEVVADEIELRFAGVAERDAFLAAYGGVVLRDDTALVIDAEGELVEVAGAMEGWHLVRIDPGRSGLVDLPGRAAALGFSGDVRFSSEEVMRTFAAVLREREALQAGPNFVGERTASLNEHPSVAGDPPTYIDWSTQWWMTHDADPTTEAIDGVAIGVAKAFDYLRHSGLTEDVWQPARVAIVDDGFNLDPVTGLGSRDYLNDPRRPPMQVDLVDYDGLAGGGIAGETPSRMWHGEKAFAVAAAWPRNGFGGAGAGGEYVRPIVIRVPLTTSAWAAAIKTAALSDAAAINLSLSSTCPFLCGTAEFFEGSHLQEEIRTATVLGSVVVTSAGNGPNNNTPDYDIDDGDVQAPCELDDVLCVGAIDRAGENMWNHGAAVDIWGPTNIRSTVTPFSAGMDGDDVGADEVDRFGGTSCASPFVAGVVGMLKAVDPGATHREVEALLQDTARAGVGADGIEARWVDAFAAVRALVDVPGPEVSWTSHTDGAEVSWRGARRLVVSVTDGPGGASFRGRIGLSSDLDGPICAADVDRGYFECVGRLSAGEHVLTASATNDLGLRGIDEIRVSVVNDAPRVLILSPEDGGEAYTSQDVVLRGQVTDLDSEVFTTDCATARPDDRCAGWTSSVDGPLSPPPGGSPLDFIARLSEGTHTLTFHARDGMGAVDEQSIAFTAVRGAGVPSVRITTPTLARPGPGGVFALRGNASDPEDGALTGTSLVWSSNVDGVLGNGASLDVALSGPRGEGVVEHRVTLAATDRDGNRSTDTVILQVIRIE